MGIKMNQSSMEPGIASTVYFVQMLVIRLALSSTVARLAVYEAAPQVQWPALRPSHCGQSHNIKACEPQ